MSATEAIRTSGVVEWFNNARGYGFIKGSDGQDVFVHFSAIKMDGYKSLEQGMEVRFELHKGAKGLEAHNVEVPEGYEARPRKVAYGKDNDR